MRTLQKPVVLICPSGFTSLRVNTGNQSSDSAKLIYKANIYKISDNPESTDLKLLELFF